MSVYKDQLNQFVSEQDVKAELLYDIGGAQNPIKGRTKSWDVKDYKIIDLATPHVEKQHPDIEHDMNEPIGEHPQADAIYCLGVSDYVICPNVFIMNIEKLMREGGYAWIEWPFVYATHEPLWDEGCRYSEGCVKRLIDHSGLKLDTIIRKMAHSPSLVRFYQEDGQRMSRNYDYHGVTGFITKVTK